MSAVQAHDLMLCLAGLLRRRERLKAIVEFLPEDRRADVRAAIDERVALNPEQIANEWKSVLDAEAELAVHVARRKLGASRLNLSNLPPVLRRWILNG